MPAAGPVTLGVFDAGGRRIRHLEMTSAEALVRLTWDGRGADAARVPAGAYFVRVSSSGKQATCRIVRIQ